MSFEGSIYLATYLIEFFVLFYLEYKTWETFYTPLNLLMFPYTLVLIITVLLTGGSTGLTEFYYPSIFVWNVGLLLFAIPSFALGYCLKTNGMSMKSPFPPEHLPRILVVLAVLLAVLFMYHIWSMLGSSSEALGSDEFGEDFSGGGLWGHLRQLTIPLLIMSIYFVSKRRWWLWPIIIVFLVVSVLNQVKGWIIIPVLAAIAMRLYTGKTKLTIRLVVYALLGAFSVFFLSYALSILFVQSRGVSNEFMEFIFGHFLHYLTSGILGFSIDAQLGFPDVGDFEKLWCPVVNIINVIAGNEDFMSPVNPYYYNTGINNTNVRTLFGTIFINSSILEFVVYTLMLSCLFYGLKLAADKLGNVYLYVIYFFECGLLAMGWFEFYFFHLIALELPVLVIILWLLDWCLRDNARFVV